MNFTAFHVLEIRGREDQTLTRSRFVNKHNKNRIKIKSLLYVFVRFIHSYYDLASI